MKKRKWIAPVVIALLLIAYYLAFFLLVLRWVPLPLWGKIVGAVLPLALVGVTVYVLIQRICEIRSGEEDDLSQY